MQIDAIDGAPDRLRAGNDDFSINDDVSIKAVMLIGSWENEIRRAGIFVADGGCVDIRDRVLQPLAVFLRITASGD